MWELYGTETFLQVLLVTGAHQCSGANWMNMLRRRRPVWSLFVLSAQPCFYVLPFSGRICSRPCSPTFGTLFLPAVASLSFWIAVL